MHMLPEDAIATINLLHPTGDPEDPDSAVPLCCLHLPLDKNGMPVMTEIPIPVHNGINLQSLTAARSFVLDGYVNCGFGAIRNQNITLEAWVMPGGPDGLPNVAQEYTIVSCGAASDPQHTYGSYGWSVGWQISMTTEPTTSNIPNVKLQLYRGGANAGASIGIADLGKLAGGRWMHITVSSNGTSVYLTVNGKGVTFLYDQRRGFIQDEIRHFPLIIGGYPLSFDPVKFAAGEPIKMYNSWSGWIKLVRVWREALTLDEISKLYDLDFEVDNMDQLFL
jgi:hypothetical protein